MDFDWLKKIIVSLLFLGVTACSPITKIEQPQITGWAAFSNQQSVGQTFTARYDGLEGVEVNINPDLVGPGNVIIHLKNDPQDIDDIATTTYSINKFNDSDIYALKFTPQKASFNQDFYVLIEVKGNSSLSIGMANGDAYQNGALYQNNIPIDNQLYFNLIYNKKLAFIGILYEILLWIKYLLIGIFLFIIPGWALFTLLYKNWSGRHWTIKLSLSTGLSLAIYPILFLWTNLIGLNLGAIYAWVPPILGLCIIIWQNHNNLRNFRVKSIIKKKIKLEEIVFLLILGLIIATRFWAIRNLPAPMWGDSYQHTVIAQLLVDNKGLFNSWTPYATITSFTYHFGFHSLAAVFHWVSELSLPQSVLWTGQILNVLAVLCLVPLVYKLKNNLWGGIFCLMLAGLVFPMPMYYLNWGRYTQLAGQIILVISVYMVWETLDNNRNDWQTLAINWLLLAGLALTHYRVLIFALCFLAAFLLFNLTNQFRSKLTNTLFIGIGSLIIFFPWLVHVFQGKLLAIQAAIVSTSLNNISEQILPTDPIGDISFYLPVVFWVLSAIIIIWGIITRKKDFLIVSLWWLLILLITNPNWIGLPGAGVITNFAVFIAIYIPAGILISGVIGFSIDCLYDKVNTKSGSQEFTRKALIQILLIILLIPGIFYGRRLLYSIDANNFSLVTYPDLKAMDWINSNVPQDSVFLVNSFLAYNNTTAVGSDAGWWLPYLSAHRAILPPINYGTESNQIANFSEIIKILTGTIQDKGITSFEARTLMQENNITHIYIGQKQGRVNNSGATFDPLELSKDNNFSEIYHRDRVWIFEWVQ